MIITHNLNHHVGALVRHITHDPAKHDDLIGIVVAREIYENAAGAAAWYYIRWIEPNGRPADDVTRLPEEELQPATPCQ